MNQEIQQLIQKADNAINKYWETDYVDPDISNEIVSLLQKTTHLLEKIYKQPEVPQTDETGIAIQQSDSPAVGMLMMYKDGSIQAHTKGFLVTTSEDEEDETMSVQLLGCNISGREMIDVALTVLAPIAEQALKDEE